MKKTLIALAVVAASSAGVAHAGLGNFQPGNLNQTVDFGGTITKEDFSNVWQWAVGSGFDQYQNKSTELTESNGKYTLNILNSGNNPILAGKTTQAVAVPVGNGVIPQISFTGFDGSKLTISDADMPINSGKAFMDIPVKEATGSDKIGSLRLNLIAVGVGMTTHPDVTNLYSLIAGTPGRIFNGGIPTETRASQIKSGVTAANTIQQFSGISPDELFAQIEAAVPGSPQYRDFNALSASDMTSDMGTVSAGAYSLGIPDGAILAATFDNKLTETMQWVAPLSIAVSYN